MRKRFVHTTTTNEFDNYNNTSVLNSNTTETHTGSQERTAVRELPKIKESSLNDINKSKNVYSTIIGSSHQTDQKFTDEEIAQAEIILRKTYRNDFKFKESPTENKTPPQFSPPWPKSIQES